MLRSSARALFLTAFLAFVFIPRLSAAPGPVRSIGPEGYVNNLQDLRFPDRADARFLLALSPYTLWESRDGGGSWRSLTEGLVHSGRLGNLAIDPFDLRHLYLVSRGVQEPPVLHESRDGGRSWSSRVLADELAGIGKLYFDTRTPGVLAYSGTGRNQISYDGGQTWSSINAGSIFGLVTPLLQASRGGYYYFAAGRQLWLFDFRLTRWFMLATLPDPISEVWGDLEQADTFFVRSGETLYRSTDGGRNFTEILSTPQLAFYRAFHQSPRNPGQLAAFTSRSLLLSTDRGSTWSEEPLDWLLVEGGRGAFDPGSGELLFNEKGGLVRRRPDGGRQSFRPRGLGALSFTHLVPAGGDRLWALASDGALFRRDGQDRAWQLVSQAPCRERLALTPWNPSRLYVTCFAGYYVSEDGGLTWNEGLDFNAAGYEAPLRILFGPGPSAGQPGSTWLLAPFDRLVSLDGGSPPIQRFGVVDALFHPDRADGLLASWNDSQGSTGFIGWKPGQGWYDIAVRSGDEYSFLSQDPSDPERIFSLNGYGGVYFSADRGRTFAYRGDSGYSGGGLFPQGGFELAIDPGAPDHLVAGGTTLLAESVDGGFHFTFPPAFHYSYGVAFDAASRLYNATVDGLQMRSPSYEPCAHGAENFCARQNRFELTVEWKTPNGETGVARKVETGSQESGLFYFFDAGNWELLVKVLDGCGLNQRFWVFTAGTTDVEYLLKVEDRWTGRIRTYWNAPGQAAEATTDTDAFATCGETAPAGTAPAESAPILAAKATDGEGGALELVGGRFEVTSTWTDFAGMEGLGTPAPLASANSGLFWFFSPENWEVLIKVLDGCAINGHYWVLAAATTDVGYELRVKELARGREKVYTNPVGVPSPAQIDLTAFSCSG